MRSVDRAGGCAPTESEAPEPEATAPVEAEADAAPSLPREPVVTYSASDAEPGQRIEHGELDTILYALGDEIFVMEAPYIVNIPPMVPHSFQNLDDDLAELVVIFPTNVWEYDVLDYFPFSTEKAKALAAEARGEAPVPAATPDEE